MKEVIIIIGVILLAGCITREADYSLNLHIVAEDMGCASLSETITEHKITDDKIIFTTYNIMPNICYELKEITTEKESNNVTIILEMKDIQMGFCDGCNGSQSLVYEIDKPPFNKTYMTIKVKLKQDILSTHSFTVKIN